MKVKLSPLEKQGLYKQYFQKSKSFLFPALGIPRSSYIQPLQTYISWKEGRIKPEDRKLICLYPSMETEGFQKFQNSMIFGSPLFETMYCGEDGRNIYIFNYDVYKKDWDYFLNGQYSKFSIQLQRAIQKYWGLRTEHYAYIDSYLFPEHYYGVYARLLDTDEETLRKGVELCDPYNPKKECLKFAKISLDNLENKT